MRIIYFGTATFAVAPLKALLAARAEHEVVAVVAQPDTRAGACPVAVAAREAGVPLLQPAKIRTEEFRTELAALGADVGIVAAYGKIIPKSILDLPRLGCLNLHGSLLPKYRGASPIQAAIAAGETVTGVTLMIMDEQVDHGPTLAVAEAPIAPTDTHATLEVKLGEVAASLLMDNLSAYGDAKLTSKEQNHDEATFTGLIDREDGRIDWTAMSAAQVERLLRAYTPWPGIYTVWHRRGTPLRLKLLELTVGEAPAGTAPGTGFVDPGCGLPGIAAAQGAVLFHWVQPEGKRQIDGKTFLNGYQDFIGAVMESKKPSA